MGRLIFKAILAYSIGAMFGASAALIAVEYNFNIVAALGFAVAATMIVDFCILRVDF